jgi:hypothetical protein
VTADARFVVERRSGPRPGTLDIVLVRQEKEARRLARDRYASGEVILSRTVDDRRVDLIAESERLLGDAARFAGAGEWGAHVTNEPDRDGSVRVRLLERRLTADGIRVEVLADCRFDASGDDAVVEAASFAAELRIWAEQRNDAIRAERLDQAFEAEAAEASRRERERLAGELARILHAQQ